MRLIDVDKLELSYAGMARIAPDDFEGMAQFFMDQVKAAPPVDAIPVDFIQGLITEPWNAGSKSRVLSWLKQEWKKRGDDEGDKSK